MAATIIRINSDKKVTTDLKILVIELNGTKFTVTEQHGSLVINKISEDSDPIWIRPMVSNEIKLT